MHPDYNDFEKICLTLYRRGSTYYRLFAKSVAPNGCWLVAPIMRELADIDVATGQDIYGEETVQFDVCGTVPVTDFLNYS